jgi:hypothetical protein
LLLVDKAEELSGIKHQRVSRWKRCLHAPAAGITAQGEVIEAPALPALPAPPHMKG